MGFKVILATKLIWDADFAGIKSEEEYILSIFICKGGEWNAMANIIWLWDGKTILYDHSL